jgi:PST family polysaccharide transporter
LKSRTISGGVTTGISQGIQFLIGLASTIVLARLLGPEEVGLVAMVLVIMGFLRIFSEAGLATATVQRDGITNNQVSNLFWINVALGGVISLGLAALSPVIALLYREPRLVNITLALCATFFLTSSAVQHLALLQRQMRFVALAVVQVSAALATLVVGVGMAMAGFGYWALVGAQVAGPLVSLLLAWPLSGWRPQLPVRGCGTRSLVHFGAHLTVSSFMWALARGSDGFLVGRFFGSGPLGIYSRTGSLLLRPIEQFLPAVNAVLVPVLARSQSEPERYRRTVLQAFDVIAAGSFLFAGLMIALASPLTLVVLGPEWEATGPVFAAMTPAAIFLPLCSVSSWLLTTQARGQDFLRTSMVGSLATVAAFMVGLRWGPTGVALANSIVCFGVILPVAYYISGSRGPVRSRDLWTRFFAHLPFAPVVFIGAWLGRPLAGGNPASELMVGTLAALLAATAFVCVYRPTRSTIVGFFALLRYEFLRRSASVGQSNRSAN